jgi:hypothetical protein
MATRTPAGGDYTTAANTAIDTILAEEAGRIGSDIHKRVMHTSPWIDLIKKSAFPDGMGYKLSTMIYDRTLPTTDPTGDVLLSGSVGWNDVGSPAGEDRYESSILDQAASAAIDSFQGANGTGGGAVGSSSDKRNFVNFSKVIKQYNIKRCVIESPRINVDDLRYAAHRQEQLRAVMDSLAESTRWSWENRYRSEFDRLADNVVACTGSSVFETGHEGTQLEDLVDAQLIGNVTQGSDAADATDDTAAGVTHNISNKVLDKVRNQLIRRGGGADAYGRENGAPVFALVLSSEASYNLMIEDDKIRQDIRYVNNKVSDLIAPLGVEQSFRGFYHLIDDLTPRYKGTASGNKLAIVQPFKVNNGITIENPEYEDAPFEAAYVLHPQVMESQIPAPFSGASGVTFDPVSYSGDYKWKNIPSEHINPDGTIGFFRGVLSSASKPIKTEMGYTIVFKRSATTSAGV